jgi:CubicO group peptidase (beta-lactamase class C family)
MMIFGTIRPNSVNFGKENLLSAWDEQDQVFSTAFTILKAAIAERAFPAASIAVTLEGKLVALKSFGQLVYTTNSGAPLLPDFGRSGDFEVLVSTLFDLASLTKVVATTAMAMILYERNILELDAPIIGIIPEFATDSEGQADPRRRQVTFRMLLAHSSGLPAYEKLFLKARTRDELLRAAFTIPLTADPATRAEYSDIGFIILGVALGRTAADSIDLFCQREIFGPLMMAHATFNPPADLRPQIPPTADERKHARTFRNRIIQGEVQDENAHVLGGVAGHAGLFSTAEDLARFANAMLQCGAGSCDEGLCGAGTPARAGVVCPETVELFTRRESSPAGTSRALGWDTPSSPSQSGKYFGPRSFGHLGYTGTSLWIDPDRQLSITLLTNRTWPDCSNQAIKQVRPALHDAIIEALKISVPT